MQVKARGLAGAMLMLGLAITGLSAFGQGQGPRREPQAAPEGPPQPADTKLLALQKDFVLKAEQLAKDYERSKQPEKARLVAEEILKIAPRYAGALEIIRDIREKEANAEDVTLDIDAKKGWQDTGVTLIPGKPVRITASGSWQLKMDHKLSAEGMELPRELRDFKLGSLVGIVDTGVPVDPKGGKDRPRPFMVGESKEFTADASGRLLLRMYDTDERDNDGKLSVKIQGTFLTKKK